MLNFLLIIMILEREKKFSLQKITYHIIKDVNFLVIFYHMIPTLRLRVIYERNVMKSMEMSFFALPSKQCPVQGRFKLTHGSAELVAGRPISLSAKAAACVRRFETPTALNYGRTESKKDISMLGVGSISKS